MVHSGFATSTPRAMADTKGPSGGKFVFIAKRGGGRTRSGLKLHRIVLGGKWGLMRDGIIAVRNEVTL